MFIDTDIYEKYRSFNRKLVRGVYEDIFYRVYLDSEYIDIEYI